MPGQHLPASASCTEGKSKGKMKSPWPWRGILAGEHMVSSFFFFFYRIEDYFQRVYDPDVTDSCPSAPLGWTSYQIKKYN